MNRGYIKLWRKMDESGLLQNPVVLQLFCYVILKASHKKTKILVNNNVVELEPGQLIFGRKRAAEDLNQSEQSIRTALETLKKMKIVTSKPTNRYSLITVENWALYQGDDQQSNQQDNQEPNQQVTSNQPAANHKQECKEFKNKKEEFKNPPTPLSGGAGEVEEVSPPCASASPAKKEQPEAATEPKPKPAQKLSHEQEFEQALQNYTQSAPVQEAFKAYRDMRKAIKKPLTAPALRLAFKKLDSLAATDAEKVAVLEQSTLNSWQSLYELKQDKITASHVPKAFKSFAQQRLEANMAAAQAFVEGNF